MTELTVTTDNYKLTVEVTRLVSDKPDPTCRDSADDYRGTRECEFRVIYGIEYNENGRIAQCGELPWWLDKLTEDHAEAIEAAIWKQYDKGQESRRHE